MLFKVYKKYMVLIFFLKNILYDIITLIFRLYKNFSYKI